MSSQRKQTVWSQQPRASLMIVDDDPTNREMLQALLEAHGFSVVSADSGAAALELLQPGLDLILLDVMMPRMDGFETCRQVREHPLGMEIPIVFLTAHDDRSVYEKAMVSGGDDFLTKPVDRAELLLRVRSLLRIRRLQQKVVAGYDDLLRVQRQKEELTALLVHDLKNPLASILANVEYLIDNSSMQGEPRDASLDILAAAEAMNRMTMNLLDISRSEDGELRPAVGQVDLDGLIAEIITVMRRRAEINSQSIEVRIEPEVRSVRADRDLLRRILENLLDNSLKYTPSGGTINVTAKPRPEGSVELRVADHGDGIPPAYRTQIFEKYVQIGNHDRGVVQRGRGLGLVFCRLATEAHGGRIWVEDGQPRGSVFCVSLPAPQAVAVASR